MNKDDVAKNSYHLDNIYIQDPGPPKYHFLGLEKTLIKRIVRLGWPVVVGMMTQTAINTIDLMMVGHLPDNIAVTSTAAILSSIVILWAFGGFLSAISVGTQAICARRYSEKNFKAAGAVLFNSITVAAIASVVLTVVAYLLVGPIFSLLTENPDVQKVGTEYTNIRIMALMSIALTASVKSFYDAQGRVFIHMNVAIIMNIFNIVFNYLFIYGFSIGNFTVAAMHAKGAAISSVISSYIGLALILVWSFKKYDRKKFGAYHLKNINWAIASKIAKLSVWSGLATLVLMAGVALFNYIISYIDFLQGGFAINASASSIIIHILMLIFMLCLAFGTSTATLVAQSIGVKKYDLAERYAWQSVRVCAYFVSIIGLIVVIFPLPLLQLFLPTDLSNSLSVKTQVIEKAIPSLRLTVGLLSPMVACGMVLTQALYGAGKTRFIMIMELVLHFFFFVPISWLLAIKLNYGLIGCWMSAVLYGFLLLLATSYKFRLGDWKKVAL